MQIRALGGVVHLKLPRQARHFQPLLVLTLFLSALMLLYYVSSSSPPNSSEDQILDDEKKLFDSLEQLKGNAEVLGYKDVVAQDPEDDEGEAEIQNLKEKQLQPKLGPVGGKPKKIKMAMDSIKDNYDQLMDVQKRILTDQNRPDDSYYNVNITLSDSTSMDRSILDTRPEACLKHQYDLESLPKMSVVIPFYNEALSLLMRTVHSILNRTPDILLQEIILVDDVSTHSHLDRLYKYAEVIPKTRVIRNPSREGLIVSRMNGLRNSIGPVVVFMDAHSEVNVGWAEPLLFELKKHPKNIVQPFVDGIDKEDLDYTSPPQFFKGSFSWDLRYTWVRVPDYLQQQTRELGIPFHSPTLVGCAMAVDKESFLEIGAFDEGMNVWGGENLELAFRVWQCGGQILTVICSRVGHVFKNFPHKFDENKEAVVQKNLIRVADVWMDDYAKYFYATTKIYDFKRHQLNSEEERTMMERKKLREKLNCKPFSWFMSEIVPDLESPAMDSVYYGEVMNLKSKACFEVDPNENLALSYLCFEHKMMPENYFRIDTNGLLRWRAKCVMVDPPYPLIKIKECPVSDFKKFGQWDIINKGVTWGLIVVRTEDEDGTTHEWCLLQVTSAVEPVGVQMPQLALCDENNHFQMWAFTYKFEFEDNS